MGAHHIIRRDVYQVLGLSGELTDVESMVR